MDLIHQFKIIGHRIHGASLSWILVASVACLITTLVVGFRAHCPSVSPVVACPVSVLAPLQRLASHSGTLDLSVLQTQLTTIQTTLTSLLKRQLPQIKVPTGLPFQATHLDEVAGAPLVTVFHQGIAMPLRLHDEVAGWQLTHVNQTIHAATFVDGKGKLLTAMIPHKVADL